MALLLRFGGVPGARGHRLLARRLTAASQGEWVVRDRDAHSWVEAWFDGIGWVTFDPTADRHSRALADRGRSTSPTPTPRTTPPPTPRPPSPAAAATRPARARELDPAGAGGGPGVVALDDGRSPWLVRRRRRSSLLIAVAVALLLRAPKAPRA